ncbi:MAG: hypothetical protein ACOC5G_00825 [Acidobacteriota bacterium]
MKTKYFIILIAVIFLMFSAAITPEIYGQQEEEQTEIIPDEVKSVLLEGMESREPCLDIPFSISDHYYLPASQNFYFILLFNAKNSDLDYTPVGGPKEEEQEEQKAFVEKTPDILQTRFDTFLIFNQLDGDYEKEIFIPAGFQVKKELLDPESEAMYSLGYILPPGKYLLAMALTQNDYQKIGTQYFEFEIKDPAAIRDRLEVASVFFIDDTQKMEEPERKTYIHKGYFTYSILKIKPVLNNTFASGQTSEILFYVMGGSQDPNSQKYDYTVNYQVIKEGQEEPLIRFAEGNYNSPLIIQPLKFERTVLVRKKKDDEIVEERTETRDLNPGQYILQLEIKDNISGKIQIKDVEINIK